MSNTIQTKVRYNHESIGRSKIRVWTVFLCFILSCISVLCAHETASKWIKLYSITFHYVFTCNIKKNMWLNVKWTDCCIQICTLTRAAILSPLPLRCFFSAVLEPKTQGWSTQSSGLDSKFVEHAFWNRPLTNPALSYAIRRSHQEELIQVLLILLTPLCHSICLLHRMWK